MSIIILITSIVSAQDFGGTPNRIKYRQIDNDTLRVVFPEGLDYWGQRVANFGLYQASLNDSSLSTPPIKTTIIIRNLTTLSNGFVAYGPYRSEYFTTPPFSQFSGVSPWLDLLHIHEYRHILQESKVMVGRKWAPEHILFGEYGWSAINFALLPDWYFEGDAVKTETLFTSSGRGRVPLFYLQIPALRANGKKYSFEKMRAGSFKDPVPSHYVLGYHMTSYMEMAYGTPAWDMITNRSIKKYALISRSSKKLFGLNNRELYANTVTHLDSFFEEKKTVNDSILLNFDPKNFTSYELPKLAEDGSLIYLKNTYRNIPAFYRFDGEKEHKIFEPGIRHSEHWYDLYENKLIWTEYVPNLLWQNEDYSSLKVLNIDNGKAHYLGIKKNKYFYPKWSEKGDKIGLIELGENTQQSIVLVDENASELSRLQLELGIFISAIVKVEDSKFWVVRNLDEQSQLVEYDLSSGEMKTLGPAFNAIIRHPIVDGDLIYFSSTEDIREQILRLNIETKEIEVMTNAPFRAIDPLIKDGGLIYISYEGIGYSIRTKSLTPIKKTLPQEPDIAFYEALGKNHSSILKDIPTKEHPTSTFKKTKEFLQIHSWIPQVIPPNFGLTLLLANKIGTFQGELTYVYNNNEGASQFSGKLNYAQIYPKLFVGASHTLNRNANTVDPPFDLIPGFFSGRSWSETDINTGVTLPFYLNRGKWSRYLSFEGSGHYLIANLSEYSPSHEDLSFPYLKGRVTFYNIKRQSKRQIYPRWGQSLLLDHSQSIDPSIATQFYFLSNFYFPGLFKTHSFSLSPYYKYEPWGYQYYFLDAYPSNYGYDRPAAENSYRILAKYTMPLWYPDIGVTGLVFFKRLYASAFYDYSYYTRPDGDIEQNTVGLDLNVNMVLLRIYPFQLGFRGFYRLDAAAQNDPFGFEVLIYGFSF